MIARPLTYPCEFEEDSEETKGAKETKSQRELRVASRATSEVVPRLL